jgi:hypothetical protein
MLLELLETSRCQHFLDNRFTDGGEDISVRRRQLFTIRKIPGTHILNKQPGTNEKGWSSGLGVERGATTLHRINKFVTKNQTGPRTQYIYYDTTLRTSRARSGYMNPGQRCSGKYL